MFVDSYIRRFFADAQAPKGTPESFVDHATSDLLAYRSFDPKTGLFFNEHNFGFMLEVAAQQFTDERAKSIISVLENSLDDGMSIQFINWCGPEIGGKLGRWSAGRKGRGALVDRVTDQRREHLMSMRFGSDGSIPVVPHNRRAFICVWQTGAENQQTQTKLAKIRKDIVNAFGGKRSAIECSPQDLLELLGQLLHCAAPGGEFTADYSENDFLNYQLPGSRIRVAADHIELAGNPSLKVASSVVARYPADWATHINEMLNGDPATPTARPIGPVLTSFTARAMNSAQAKAKIGRKLTGVMSNAGTSMEKWIPDLGEKKKEFHDLNILLDSGGRLFETVYSVSSYAKAEIFESDPIGRMAGIYRSVGLHFSDDRHLQLPILLGSLPFGMHDKFLEDFKRSMRMRIMPADAVGVLAPLSGEYAGTYKFSGIPLIGRQNSLSNWSNFDSSANYNVTVVGKSGAGKSVLMQDLSMAHYAEGGRIIVVDDGRSFEGLCNILGGDFIAFGDGEIAELNPFALVDAERMLEEGYFAEAVEMVTNIVGTMCALDTDYKTSRVSGLEEGFLGEAVKYAWQKEGNKATVQLVYDFLRENEVYQKDERVQDMLVKLARFTSGGDYHSFFNKGATLSIDSDFVVFEMAELKSKKVLMEVIMQLIMFLATEVMFKTDRSVRTALLIDEAWAILGGPSTAVFVEGVVRRARKYSGCLICGTQSVDDFFNNPAAKVIFENSDNFICMQQKPEAIQRLANESKIDVDPATAQTLKSLMKVPGQYTEMGIHTPEGWLFARLVLDQFSLGMFSTDGDTVARRNEYIKTGYSPEDAIDLMIKNGEVH